MTDLAQLENEILAEITAAGDDAALEAVRVAALGKNGTITALLKTLGALPPEQRGQAFGLAQGGINLGQGVVMILAGAAAGRFAPAIVIAVIGALGVLAATAVTFSIPRRC